MAKSETGLFLKLKMGDPHNSPLAFKFSNPGAYITYLMILYLPWEYQLGIFNQNVLIKEKEQTAF